MILAGLAFHTFPHKEGTPVCDAAVCDDEIFEDSVVSYYSTKLWMIEIDLVQSMCYKF